MKSAVPSELIQTLKVRFEKNMQRHEGVVWGQVQARLEASGAALRALGEMERSGGEPDVIGYDKKAGQYLFCDCSSESPSGRRSLCYDRRALDSRKQNKPSGCVTELAAAMGVELHRAAVPQATGTGRVRYQDLQLGRDPGRGPLARRGSVL